MFLVALFALMQPRLDERHRQIRRLEEMLSAEWPEPEDPAPSSEERERVGSRFRQLAQALQGKGAWPQPFGKGALK